MSSIIQSIAPSCRDLDSDSVAKILKGGNQIMVYGFNHCQYMEVCAVLESPKTKLPIKRVFDYYLGKFVGVSEENVTTLEGRKMNRLVYEDTSMNYPLARQCKTGIVNLVLENYKRKKEGLPLIPLIFCVDIEGNPKPDIFKNLVKNMTTKDRKLNRVTTHKELRRAYKLCSHENSAIREAARETIKIVRLRRIDSGTYATDQIAAPWESPEFAACWEARQKLSTSKPKENSWRVQLDRQIARYESMSHMREAMAGKALALSQQLKSRT